jgi:hypothetical protein
MTDYFDILILFLVRAIFEPLGAREVALVA